MLSAPSNRQSFPTVVRQPSPTRIELEELPPEIADIARDAVAEWGFQLKARRTSGFREREYHCIEGAKSYILLRYVNDKRLADPKYIGDLESIFGLVQSQKRKPWIYILGDCRESADYTKAAAL